MALKHEGHESEGGVRNGVLTPPASVLVLSFGKVFETGTDGVVDFLGEAGLTDLLGRRAFVLAEGERRGEEPVNQTDE